MKNIFSFILFTAFSINAFSKTINIENTSITFDAPETFQPIPQEYIDIKYPNKNAPKFVIGNESAATTIAYDLKPYNLEGVNLEDVRLEFEATFNRMIPGIEWKESKVITLNQYEWIFFEMTSNAIDTDIYNIMLITSYGKEMLLFNFNSTREEFSQYESELRKSLQSIKIAE